MSVQEKKSLPELVKEYLNEIEKYRTSEPDFYIDSLKRLRMMLTPSNTHG